MEAKELNGIKIGDTFMKGKNIKCIVVDFHTVTNLAGKIVRYEYIAQQINGFASNSFEVTRTTILRGLITD